MPRYGGSIFPTPSRSSSFRRRKSPESDQEETAGDQPGYFWLDHLPKSLAEAAHMGHSLSPNPDSWMIESARQFVSSLNKVVESINSRGRSVWLMARPLRNGIVPTSGGNVAFCHWGILISYLTKYQLGNRISELDDKGSLDSILGDLHELRNQNGDANYNFCSYRGKDNERATRLDYLGQTEITDAELFELGMCFSILVLI
jgi:hypothetical protein